MPVHTPSRLRDRPHRHLLLVPLLASAALSACHDDHLSTAPQTLAPMPTPVPTPMDGELLPPVIHCAPGATTTAAAESHTLLAADCRAVTTGAAS